MSTKTPGPSSRKSDQGTLMQEAASITVDLSPEGHSVDRRDAPTAGKGASIPTATTSHQGSPPHLTSQTLDEHNSSFDVRKSDEEREEKIDRLARAAHDLDFELPRQCFGQDKWKGHDGHGFLQSSYRSNPTGNNA